MLRRRLLVALRGLHDPHGVLARDQLRTGGLEIALAAPQAGEDDRLPAGDEVAAVQFRRDLDGQAQRRKASAVNSVSGAAERKLPPRAKKTFACPACMARMASTVS